MEGDGPPGRSVWPSADPAGTAPATTAPASDPPAPQQPQQDPGSDRQAVARRWWDSDAARVLNVFLAFKIVVFLSSWLLLERPEGFLRDVSTAWDGENYLRVARHGYQPDGATGLTSEYHWPPLFPLLIRAVGAGDMAPFWINNLAGAVAVVGVTRLMGIRAGLFFALFPTWVVYSTFGYTEGLFVLFSVVALLLWRHGDRLADVLVAGTAAGAAIAVRYAGLFPFLTFGIWALRTDPARAVRFAVPVAAVGAVLAGWHHATTGTVLAYVEASKPWGSAFGWPWGQVEWIYDGWFTNQPGIREHHSFWLLRNAAFMLPSFFGFALLARRWRQPGQAALVVFSAGTVFVTLFAANTQILGIPRYLIAAFPAIAVLGERVRDRGGWAAYAIASWVVSCWIVVGQLTGFFA